MNGGTLGEIDDQDGRIDKMLQDVMDHGHLHLTGLRNDGIDIIKGDLHDHMCPRNLRDVSLFTHNVEQTL